MIRIAESVVIGRSVGDVFAYVSDQTNAPSWQRGLHDVRRTTDGPLGVGTRHTFVRRLMGRTIDGSNEYTRWEPGRLVAFKATSGAMDLEASYVVEPAGADQTRLTSRLDLRPTGLLRLAEPLVEAGLTRDVKANLATLKRLLENSETAGTEPTGGV
jgi:uncharacterized membrane protein